MYVGDNVHMDNIKNSIWKTERITWETEYSEWLEVSQYFAEIYGVKYCIKPFYKRFYKEFDPETMKYDYDGVHISYEVYTGSRFVAHGVKSLEEAKELAFNHFEKEWQVNYVRDLSQLQESIYKYREHS